MKPTVYLLSASAIADDPRVRRMGDAMHARGWTVTGIGLPGGRSSPPDWPVIAAAPVERSTPPRSTRTLDRCERALGELLSLPLVPVGHALRAAGSPWGQFALNVRDRAKRANQPISGLVRAFQQRLASHRLPEADRLRRNFWHQPHPQAIRAVCEKVKNPAIWVANDWPMLPVAVEAARRTGGVVVYDSHELATEESSERPEWREFTLPIVKVIEAEGIREAKVISAVSPGIVSHLQRQYAVPAPHLVVRNTPPYSEGPMHETGAHMRILYHGILAEGRGLEASIAAIAQLPDHFALTIRGPESLPGYSDRLRKLAADLGVAERVTLAPPVPMTALVDEARPFDIGIMALPGHSLHNQYALPNKIFEYMMAGLALAVSDLPEMRQLIEETGAGLLIGDGSPGAIAAALADLTPACVQGMRLAAREAARTYNWEIQCKAVLDAYAQAFYSAVS